jgi:two-component system, OmpR family, phosphate regulon response regulator PhoB
MTNILLIDDEPELLELLEYFFKQLNYRVISYPDAIAIETIKNLSPDLIVLDHNLGEISGGELCRQLKINPDTQNIPVLMLSGDSRLPDLAKDSCADTYLHKPFDIAALAAAVKKITSLENS